MVHEMNMLQQAKQRYDQEIAVLRDQVTKQRSQIAVLKELVDQVSTDQFCAQVGWEEEKYFIVLE